MDSNSLDSTNSPCRRLFTEDDGGNSPTKDGEDGVGLMDMNNQKILDTVHSHMDEKMISKLGLEFETDEEAYNFYLAYAKRVGFGIKKFTSHKDKNGKLVDRVICCTAHGHRAKDTRQLHVKKQRPETRCGCGAIMKVKRGANGKFAVYEIVLKHSHYLASPSKSHMIPCHRRISDVQAAEIEMSNSVGIAPKNAHELMAKQAGGMEELGFGHVDYKNYLRTKRQKMIEKGDTSGVLEYLQRMQSADPNFFYGIQMDAFDMMTNIFWCDAKMKSDYVHFGDVVCFDTTYGKNKEGRPIALFVGVNHHKQSVIFGAALLYDETADSFGWLFDTFSVAMSGVKPTTILTDQDAAMASALALKWPETHHRLCIWHIYKNAAIHLSHVFSEFKGFTTDFQECVYDFDEEDDFVSAWESLLDKYKLRDNSWMKRLFEIREKWALVYGRQVFCGDMTTTQRVESMNMQLKRYVSYKNSFLDFFNNFERLIEDRRYAENVADFKANSTKPVLNVLCELNKHASSVYTPKVLTLFEAELSKAFDGTTEECECNGAIRKYKVTPPRKSYYHTVTHDTENGTFDCICKKFEFSGILCWHVIKIFIPKGINKIPEQYILKRWTRKAKSGHVGHNDVVMDSSVSDAKVLYRLRYKDLCHLNVQLATKAAETEDTYLIARNRLLETLDLVDVGLQSVPKNVNTPSLNVASSNSNVIEVNIGSGITVKGIATKEKTTSGKRKICALEQHVTKKRGSRLKKSCNANNPVTSCEVTGLTEHYEERVSAPDVLTPCYQPYTDSQTSQQSRSYDMVSAPGILNHAYYQSYVESQTSQVHGSSSFNSNDGICNCVFPCQAGTFCPSSGYFA